VTERRNFAERVEFILQLRVRLGLHHLERDTFSFRAMRADQVYELNGMP